MPKSILLHVRCPHCLKLFQQTVAVPSQAMSLDDEELIESAFIREMKFVCPRDETPYGEIVAFKIIGEPARAA